MEGKFSEVGLPLHGVLRSNPPVAADELVGWFQHHPKDDCCVDIFALSTGGPSEVIDFETHHFIVLKDVKGVPVVIYYNAVKDHFDKFVPVAKKVLESVEWTGT